MKEIEGRVIALGFFDGIHLGHASLLEMARKRAEELKKEEDLLLKRERNADPKAQRKLLVRLLAFVLIMVILLLSALVYVKAVKPKSYHHEVIMEEQVE